MKNPVLKCAWFVKVHFSMLTCVVQFENVAVYIFEVLWKPDLSP
jgi:hypothetical protein